MSIEPLSNGLTRAEREAMLESVKGLIVTEVRRAGVPVGEREDVIQDGQVLLWEQTAKFDPSRGTKFSTFACACLRTMLAGWKAKHNGDFFGAIQQIGDHRDFDMLACTRTSDLRRDEPVEDDGEIGDAGGSSLANAVRRKLAEGILQKLSESQRRLIEQVVFEGLTVEQIAVQAGHPLKVIRLNLKNAIRRLCTLGLLNHVASDEEVASVTAGPKPMTPENREKHRASCRESGRRKRQVEVMKDLKDVVSNDAFTVELDALDDDMRVIVTALIDGSLTVDDSLELLGVDRRVLTSRIKRLIKKVAKQATSNPATTCATVDRAAEGLSAAVDTGGLLSR